jgi:hypothetical protein
MRNAESALVLFLALTAGAPSDVRTVIDHNPGSEATPAFRFKHVPSPAKDNAAAGAKVELVVGRADGNSAAPAVLTDGVLPAESDQPEANFFFADGTDGGRFLIDLGRLVEIAQVNTYSWHSDSRAPQVYNLFASDGADPGFNRTPGANTDPASCGWKLIATVDTRAVYGDDGGQYGVSITGATAALGKFRYLLFDSIASEVEDDWGNTFFSEVNVIAAQPK